ncbi:MAG TPA: 4Fe-4S dicluster domain-containing protein [Dissulfurispiraceae bacterium]|nr:4Fe-4S dicluster domain-containing protein [Dissulfurispiraceae bacterium]
MGVNRREFLKFVSMSTLLGLGGTTVAASVKKELEASGPYIPDPKGINAKRWAMAVDMRKFKSDEDIQKCIDACHQVHNVPEADPAHPTQEIKWIWTESYERAFPGNEDEYLAAHYKHMPFLILCNHCENPPCVRVCPTKATFKRHTDGIVMMDMHRCIGCRFCMAACPYGARSFNFRDPRPFIKRDLNQEFPTRTKGVVEKCTFCYERLAKGLQPACAEISNGAIAFGDLDDPESPVRKVIDNNFTIRRKPELGTHPSVYYVIGGQEHA